jgi:hypothetical protein
LSSRLAALPDAGDEKIVEQCVIRAIVRKANEMCCGIERIGRSIARIQVRIVVRAVAMMSTTRGRCDVMGTGDDAVFEDGAVGVVAFDSETNIC